MPRHESREDPGVVAEYIRRDKLQRRQMQVAYLRDCRDEQVLPVSAPKRLKGKDGDHPFPPSARAFLTEQIEGHLDDISLLKEEAKGIHLPHRLVAKLKQMKANTEDRLQRKLVHACNNSRWTTVGRTDLIDNRSKRVLTQEEIEALSLGLKFDIGYSATSPANLVRKNNRYNSHNLDSGFRQGLIVFAHAIARSNPSNIPRRHVEALKSLAADTSINISSSDKGGGIVILDNEEYLDKMHALLADNNTYRKVAIGSHAKAASAFEKAARTLLNRCKDSGGSKLKYLLEEDPKTPRMYGLPKTHKENCPLRPITSGVGSAPHRLAKILANPLSGQLGSISGCHVKNSTELLERLVELSTRNKKLASFDVKNLFTNVPIDGSMEAVERTVQNIPDNQLPIPRQYYVKLIRLCVEFNSFQFEGTEYEQITGLAMGSPLSPVLAQLFMEVLEHDHYKKILGPHVIIYRYVDDYFLIVPRRTNLQTLLAKLNAVDPAIQLTLEEEVEGRLPVLDILFIRENNQLLHTVYRKPTNKDDFIHYYSGHAEEVKAQVVKGFYRRAFRICNDQFLQAELDYITNAFNKLRYPRGKLLNWKRQVQQNLSRQQTAPKEKLPWITLPASNATTEVAGLLKGLVNIATPSGTKIGQILKRKQEKQTYSPLSCVYEIPCSKCPDASYIGETRRGFKEKRLSEHQSDVRKMRVTNAMVKHLKLYPDHKPAWDKSKVLYEKLSNADRKLLEACTIATKSTVNSTRGKFPVSEITGQLGMSCVSAAGVQL